MPVQSFAISVTSTPTVLAGSTGSAARGVLRVWIRNRGAATIYLGGTSAITTGGCALSTDDAQLSLVLQPWDVLYGVTSSGTITVNGLRSGDTT